MVQQISKLGNFMSQMATNSYKVTTSYSAPIAEGLTNDEKSMAIRGMTFTQPYQIPDGINMLTGGNCGGLLNLLGKYNDDGEAPMTTWSRLA